MATDAAQSRIFLSTLPADTGERRRALASAMVFLIIFLAVAPFARIPLPQVWGFIPSYQSALVTCDLITAVLLLAQFVILRARALLPLALGYLFCALIAIAHALTFPGLFSPEGLLGAQPQTTAWLYMAWHGGFPVAVIAYALLGKSRGADRLVHYHPYVAIAAGTLLVAGGVGALVAVATTGHDLLPEIMAGHHYTGAMLGTVSTVWAVVWIALAVLWSRRPHSVLDVWLMVILVAWLGDVALSAMLNAGRFDLGFYAGRAFGLCAASFILIVLLLETITLYARMATSFESETAERDSRLSELRLELIHVGRLNELGQMVSALSHELNQPLTAATTYIETCEMLRDSNPDRSRQVLRRAAEQIERAGHVITRIRQFVKKGDVEWRSEDLVTTIKEAVALATIGTEELGIGVRTVFGPSVPYVFIDRVQIQQVLINLIRNAVEAMADGSRRELVIRAVSVPDDMVEISIADTGPGLDKTVRARLFQPFVTTKSAGMGVGLSICHSIVELHHGRMWVTDNPGGGTVFHFTIAAADAENSDPVMGLLHGERLVEQT